MVYVVLLNWNGARDTIACLKSLAMLKGSLPKVIVCDNASTDGSWLKLQGYIAQQQELEILLVQTGSNLGFGGGNNVGLRLALADSAMEFVWLLNSDTVVTPTSLIALKFYMKQHPHVGICGSTLLYEDEPKRIQAVGGKYNRWLGTSKHLLGHQLYSAAICKSISPQGMDYVVGASMFVRRAVLECVGLLSEDYFLYCEEIDWATRMKRAMPLLELGYAPESLVYHKQGLSTLTKDSVKKSYSYFSDYFFITSRLIFARKYFFFRSLVVQAAMSIVALKRLVSGQPRSALVAICCFFGVVPRWLDPRRVSGR